MADWGEFAGVFILFLVSHYLPSRPGVRLAITRLVGERVYLLIYSLISLVLLGWLIVAAGRAPYVALWDFAPWQIWVPNLVTPAAILLAALGIAAPNPFSFAGRKTDRFDPDRPGIAGLTRHPLLWAILLWAGAHLVPNGNLAHVLLFGFFMAMAIAGMLMIDRRRARAMEPPHWRDMARRTSLIPFANVIGGRFSIAGIDAAPVRLAVAVAVYLVLLLLHGPLIGVSPLPV